MEENVLDQLAAGYVSKSCPTPLSPEVLAALAATVSTGKKVQQISTPVNAKTIDLGSLAIGTENEPEFTFTNNSGVTVVYWFSALYNTPGSASDFGVSGNSAVDYPGANGSGPHSENGGSDLRVFNKKVIAVGGFVVAKVQVTTAAAGSQKNQRLIINTNNVANDPCTGRILAPFCDTCNNNSNDDQFVATFNGPIGVGAMSSFGYPVLDGQEVTVRLFVIGQAVNQYKSIGSATC